MKAPVVVHHLTAAQAQQMKLIFEIYASVTLVPDEAGTFTLVAIYPDDPAADAIAVPKENTPAPVATVPATPAPPQTATAVADLADQPAAVHDAFVQNTIAWGKVLSSELRATIVNLATRLDCDPSHLTACMAFETGETFSPTKQNSVSGATGLIQFMPQTAQSLGTSIAQLLGMTAVQQMAYVEKYFLPYSGRLKGLSDVYMAILWPSAIGKPDSSALFVQGSKYYSQNAGLDVNKDGVVTKGEAASKPQGKLNRGLTQGLVG
ncbi:hypothetical protein [Mesorhizobium sp. M0478]|uniref:hypothetical protein n=1 Tax=Mesorhizobium sp. M0478 TaxID=2956947 RepID=UPI0033387FBE